MLSTNASPTPSRPASVTGKASVRLRFLLTFSLVCGLLVIIGWASDLRGAFHGMLLALSVAAFLPLLVVLACIVLFFVVCLVAVMAGDSDALSAADSVGLGEGIVVYFKRILVPYYRFLFTRRSPVFLGAVSGFLLGTTLLWALLTLIVLPGEVCSLTRLTALQNAIDRYYKSHGKYPSPVQDKWLGREVLSDADADWPACKAPAAEPEGGDAVLLDGFGQRIHYSVAGRGRLASYGLRSLGYDGRQGDDDICLTGETRGQAALDRVAGAADSVGRLFHGISGKLALHHRWAALRAASCSSDSRGRP